MKNQFYLQPKTILILFFSVLFSFHGVIAAPAKSAIQNSQINLDKEFSNAAPAYKTTWSLGMEAAHSDDDLSNQKTQITFGLNLKFDANYKNGISLNLNPKIMAQNGYFQSQEAIDPSGSRIEVKNAALNFTATDALSISLGALNQMVHHDPLFMSDRAFPSLRSIIKSSEKEYHKFSAFIEGAIPTSSSLSNNSNDFTKSPSLVMAGFNYTLGDQNQAVLWSTQLNTYQFKDLPQTVATASVLYGNAGTATSGRDYIFKNEFQGYELFSRLLVQDFKETTFDATFAMILNSQASTGSNKGWRISAALGYDLNRRFQIKPGFEYFAIEEDATVAAYNNMFMNTNRIGYVGSLSLVYNKLLKFNLQGGERVPIIDKGTAQPSEKFYLISVETTDAKI